jgi:hypothetical protein
LCDRFFLSGANQPPAEKMTPYDNQIDDLAAQMDEAQKTLSDNLEYLRNNDEGRHLPIRYKEQVFRTPYESFTARLEDITASYHPYNEQGELQHDLETFQADVQTVIEEARESCTPQQVTTVLHYWALVAQRDQLKGATPDAN